MGACAGKHKENDNEINEDHPNGKDEQNKAASSTTLYDLPLEMLDIILQNSYLYWTLSSSKKKRDEEVIRSLISVDVCFNRRLTRKRFKTAIWRYLKNFYRKTKKRSALITNNRKYLLENIQPNDELIASLLYLNCITEEQSHFIQRQFSNREKNAELLYAVETFDETKLSNFVKCLRQNDQRTMALLIENGGGVIKIKVKTRGAKCITSINAQLLHKEVEDLRNRTKTRSHLTDEPMSQLLVDGIEILNSHLDRQTVVVWIWCHSQEALEHIQRLYESNQLRDVFFENIQPSTSKIINIDRNQFKKTVAVCSISISLTQRIEVGREESMYGVHAVTTLRNEIYAIFRSKHYSSRAIHVFENRNSFRLQKKIKIKIRFPHDIGSSEKENCLYIIDGGKKRVWKITKEEDDQHKFIKWLKTDYHPLTLSMSNEGQLLMINRSSSILMIYGSDAELIRAIQLPRNIKHPIHAVETSMGNFVILYWWFGKEDEREIGSSWRKRTSGWDISEVTRDGQMVIRRFIPSNETQELNAPEYFSIDSDDRVFVLDNRNHRVILLDSDLKWNRIPCPAKEETKETRVLFPGRLCYDKEKKLLIVAGYYSANVYTLSQN